MGKVEDGALGVGAANLGRSERSVASVCCRASIRLGGARSGGAAAAAATATARGRGNVLGLLKRGLGGRGRLVVGEVVGLDDGANLGLGGDGWGGGERGDGMVRQVLGVVVVGECVIEGAEPHHPPRQHNTLNLPVVARQPHPDPNYASFTAARRVVGA